MTLEPILAFFLLRYFRKTLRKASPVQQWDYILKVAMYGIGALFLTDVILHIGPLAIVICYLLLSLIVFVTFTKEEFAFAKTVIMAVLPLLLVSLVSHFFELLLPGLYKVVDAYLAIAGIFSVIWMITMLVIYNKQRKALDRERQKTQEEEAQRKWMATRKAELEEIVAERTAEITEQKEELEHALANLKTTQAQLIHAEKMASLGELTAGIAHEIQNPLNFVNNFSEISVELLNELKDGVLTTLNENSRKQAGEILSDLTQNLEKITHHGKRADAIVKGMLQHSRSSSGQKVPTDINALADEYLRLSYHGLRAKDKTFNAIMKTDFDEHLEKINVVPQDIGRVILNLITNAFYSVTEKKKMLGENYEPTISISTKYTRLPVDGDSTGAGVEIRIRDNGLGISQKALDKIYQPFFSTKPTGQGTGLGLSISYDIVKSHGGEMKVETQPQEFAEFIILLPYH